MWWIEDDPSLVVDDRGPTGDYGGCWKSSVQGALGEELGEVGVKHQCGQSTIYEYVYTHT